MEQSNKYASECMSAEKFDMWTEITVEESCAYLGFMIFMGIVHLPSLYDYWKTDEVYHFSPVASRISCRRFLEIHQYLHFVNNSSLSLPGSPEYDRLGKVRSAISILSERLPAVCEQGKHVSVDEAMIPFKGRSTLKQYMPKKPVRRSLKIWALADVSNGYVSSFQVYTGKDKETVEYGLGGRVVDTLTKEIYGTHRHIYFDNFFSSIDLLSSFGNGLYGCGTLRSNRKGFPPQRKDVVKKGFTSKSESKTYQMKRLTVSVWQDNKIVSNCHQFRSYKPEYCI